MEATYYLISSCGFDVIIIPELDCRIYVYNPLEDEINQKDNELLRSETINGRKLVFKIVGKDRINEDDIVRAIRWYSDQNAFINQRAAS